MPAGCFTARWVLPVAGPPLERGIVAIRNGRIDAVLPHGERQADVDLGNVAIVPGLANPHTHLDLSGARGLIPPTDQDHFTEWLLGVIAYRRGRTTEQVQVDIRAGLAECLRFGTTLIGDIAAEGASWEAMREATTRAVVFYELIGLSEERARAAEKLGRDWFESRDETRNLRAGISPHAPYSVHGRLIPQAGQIVRVKKRPTAIHLAEWRAEIELIHFRQGPLVPFLKGLGVWDKDAFTTDLAGVMKGCDQRQPKLFIHCNNLAPSTRVPRNSTIVYCPRTHAAFGHPPHPFREFLRRGVRVCLGTDSLASNPDLDILAEARFVREKHPDFPGDQLLRMITLSGAEALGWADEAGTLEPGKSADFVAIPLPNADGDPHDLLFANHPGDRRTLFRGEWRS